MGESITLNVKLQAFVRMETKRRWVAICPMLDVASQGDSQNEAKRHLREAVEAWFESCLERGVLDQALRESNFRPLPPGVEPHHSSEHVAVTRARHEDNVDDLLGDHFSINVEIPAYQASAFLSSSA